MEKPIVKQKGSYLEEGMASFDGSQESMMHIDWFPQYSVKDDNLRVLFLLATKKIFLKTLNNKLKWLCHQ